MAGEGEVGPCLIAWGSYDASKPRVRLLLDSLRGLGALGAEINIPVWQGIRDKAVAGRGRLAAAALRLLISYPGALIRLLRQPRNCAILLGYPAILDIFLAWPIARLRRQRIVLDAFVPLHDTLVGDRAMARPDGWLARAAWRIERAALRRADILLVDTDAHGDYYAQEFGIDRKQFETILVGAEDEFWAQRDRPPATELRIRGNEPVVLFYGQLIPLHGIEVILEAARITSADGIQWLIVGSGQEEPALRRALAAKDTRNVTWQPWVDYDRLPGLIARSTVALGVFGTSAKAGRVIPNKMFQILAAGKPIITRAGSAVDPIARRFPGSVVTVPAGDGAALAEAVREAIAVPESLRAVPMEARPELGPLSGARRLITRLDSDPRGGA